MITLNPLRRRMGFYRFLIAALGRAFKKFQVTGEKVQS